MITIDDIKKQEERKIRITEEIDSVISTVCKKIENNTNPEDIKAIAMLVLARAFM